MKKAPPPTADSKAGDVCYVCKHIGADGKHCEMFSNRRNCVEFRRRQNRIHHLQQERKAAELAKADVPDASYRTAALPEYKCAGCGRKLGGAETIRKDSSGKVIAVPVVALTRIGGKPYCPSCAKRRFRRVNKPNPYCLNVAEPGRLP